MIREKPKRRRRGRKTISGGASSSSMSKERKRIADGMEKKKKKNSQKELFRGRWITLIHKSEKPELRRRGLKTKDLKISAARPDQRKSVVPGRAR